MKPARKSPDAASGSTHGAAFAAPPMLVEQSAGVLGEHLGQERLGQVDVAPAASAAARLASSPRVVSTITGRRAIRRMPPHELQHFEPVHVGHVEVEHHQADRAERELFDRFEAAAGFDEAAGRRARQARHGPCAESSESRQRSRWIS